MFFKRITRWWESICYSCGQCCCEKVRYSSVKDLKRRIPGVLSVNRKYFIDYGRPCSFLDIESGLCMVYEQRFKHCRGCIPMTIFHALFADYLSPDCAYVKKFRFWRKKG